MSNTSISIEQAKPAGVRTPAEILVYSEQVAMTKSKSSLRRLMILAVFAGFYISFGAMGGMIASSSTFRGMPGLTRLINGVVFPVGLLMVILAGSELFTGNCLLYIGVKNKIISIADFAKNLTVVWIFNLVGAVLIALLAIYSGAMPKDAIEFLQVTAMDKVNAPLWVLFIKGIGCNILVCVAVWLSYSSDQFIGKALSAWFVIMLFVVLGFEHIVANMFYLPAAYFSGADITLTGILGNFVVVTIGNMIGGSLVVGGLYNMAYKEK